MIRHLTTLEAYESISKDGVIKPRNKDGRDKGVVSFEKYQGNDEFVRLFSKPSNLRIVGIFVDEQKLSDDGYKIYSTDSSSLQSRKLSKHTTKYENIVRFKGDETKEEYKNIGEYIHVYGEIPITYIEKVEFY
jgi:hypothetical protein